MAEDFETTSASVHRYEDKLIDATLAATVHQDLMVMARSREGIATLRPETDDPLWSVLGATDLELAEALLRNARIKGFGFDAQEYGRREPSRASTGTVTYALAMTPGISDDVITELYSEIIGWIDLGGLLPRRAGSTEPSTWTESLCLLALTARPHLLEDRRPVRALADVLFLQQQGGGWSYRGDATSDSDVTWSFYPLLALNRASRVHLTHGVRYRDAATRTAEWSTALLKGELDPITRLLTVALLHLSLTGTDENEWTPLLRAQTESLAAELRAEDVDNFDSFVLTDEGQGLWYARINPALFYLHSRRILSGKHAFTQSLARRLIAEYDSVGQGWTNSPGARPYTWTTAIGIRSCQFIRRDILNGSMPWSYDTPIGEGQAQIA